MDNNQGKQSSCVAFVILHYGDITITEQCVRSIAAMEQQDRIRMVIVNNEITADDERKNVIEVAFQPYANAVVLHIQEDGGFSHANNVGYAFAREQLGADIIVVANNDIEFLQPEFISLLDNVAADENVYVAGPDTIKASTLEHQNAWNSELPTFEEANATIWKNELALKLFPAVFPALFLAEKKRGEESISRKEEFDHSLEKDDAVLFGACLIFLRPFIELEAKAFFPETHFYYEENILALRCRRNGWKMRYCPELRVLHESGGATKTSYKGRKKRLKFEMANISEACRVYREYLLSE